MRSPYVWLAVRAELALVAVHDDVEHFLERQAVLECFGPTVYDDVAQQISDR
jgi:hypothetical protein